MPIRFRCSYCNRLLGIATRKAGTETTCPHCGYTITVPTPEAAEAGTQRVNLDDVTELLEGSQQPAAATSSAQAPQAKSSTTTPPSSEASKPVHPKPPVPVMVTRPTPPPTRPTPPPIPEPQARLPEDRPLFEGDVDDILGSTPAPASPVKPRTHATSGMDALSLGEPAKMSAGRATLLMIVVALLLALAFAAGLFLAPRG